MDGFLLHAKSNKIAHHLKEYQGSLDKFYDFRAILKIPFRLKIIISSAFPSSWFQRNSHAPGNSSRGCRRETDSALIGFNELDGLKIWEAGRCHRASVLELQDRGSGIPERSFPGIEGMARVGDGVESSSQMGK